MALEVIHDDVKERMWEKFVAVEREAYANGFDLRHYRQDVLFLSFRKHLEISLGFMFVLRRKKPLLLYS